MKSKDYILLVIIFWLIYAAITGIWMGLELWYYGRTFPNSFDTVIAAAIAFLLTVALANYLNSL